MSVKKIMAACGSGIGSSLMVRMNIEKVLRKSKRILFELSIN